VLDKGPSGARVKEVLELVADTICVVCSIELGPNVSAVLAARSEDREARLLRSLAVGARLGSMMPEEVLLD